MMAAGYVGHEEGWQFAGLITIPGGFVILGAFLMASTAERAEERTPAPSAPAAPGVAIATLLSGGVMVLAGYALAAWSLVVALALASLGGVIIAVAFALGRRRPTAG